MNKFVQGGKCSIHILVNGERVNLCSVDWRWEARDNEVVGMGTIWPAEGGMANLKQAVSKNAERGYVQLLHSLRGKQYMDELLDVTFWPMSPSATSVNFTFYGLRINGLYPYQRDGEKFAAAYPFTGEVEIDGMKVSVVHSDSATSNRLPEDLSVIDMDAELKS